MVGVPVVAASAAWTSSPMSVASIFPSPLISQFEATPADTVSAAPAGVAPSVAVNASVGGVAGCVYLIVAIGPSGIAVAFRPLSRQRVGAALHVAVLPVTSEATAAPAGTPAISHCTPAVRRRRPG